MVFSDISWLSTLNTPGTWRAAISVHLVRNDALECDVAVLDDNVDRRNGTNGILEQRAVVIEDRSIRRKPVLVVHGRKRQNFDLVLDCRSQAISA